MGKITYHYRGQIERSTKGDYKWYDGYSANSENGHVFYPWMTKKECRQDAKSQGATAEFSRTEINSVDTW